jgi:His-Xaa-Ser repeat protein HxsA
MLVGVEAHEILCNLYTVRNHVRDYVDQFINAYLSVNPRPIGSATPSSTSPRRDLIRQVQERLQTVGYNPGTIDGTMGPQTKNALLWFQNAQGLRSTGDLDEPTLNALGVQ